MREWREGWIRSGMVALLAALLMGVAGVLAANPPADPLTLLQQRDEKLAATQPGTQEQRVKGLESRETVSAERLKEQAASLTQEQVKSAVARGSDHLLRRLQVLLPKDGEPEVDQRQWRGFAGDQRVGVVALAVEALIESGRIVDDPRLHPLSGELAAAVKYLETARSPQTYSTALQASALSMLPAQQRFRQALARVRNTLASGMREDGGYGYSLAYKNYWDNSNTQFAVLGMWAAADAGVEVPVRFWQVQDQHWRHLQGTDGGWGYRELVRDFKVDDEVAALAPLPSMSAAGLATLYVTADQMLMPPAGQDAALAHGLAKVESDFQNELSTIGRNLYYTYAVERVGVASGRKYFGKIDWYRDGAAALLLAQQQDGSWDYAGDLAGTSLALLFLTHGGAPLIFNVLEYGKPGQWDPEPRAAAKLTRWMTRTLERRLNWQIVSLRSAPADWLDAPILLISGEKDPDMSNEDIGKLRAYIRAGGMIFSMGSGDEGPFTQAIKRYAKAVVGDQGDFRKLPPDHPFFNVPEKIKGDVALWGVSNGVREVWVHSPVDLGATWQTLIYHVAEHWQVPLNMMRYATGQERPRGRLENLSIVAPADAPARVIMMARVRYRGNWDPEPGAWPRLAAMMARDAGVGLRLQDVDAAKLDAHATPIAHLTGSGAFVPDEAENAGLAHFLRDGGVIIADAAGGSAQFSKDFKAMAETFTGDRLGEMLRADSPMFSGTLAGSIKIGEIRYRKATPVDLRIMQDRPEIIWWKDHGRAAILFSQSDLTAGLIGTETWGIAGYRPDVAQRVAQDLVIFAASLAASKK